MTAIWCGLEYFLSATGSGCKILFMPKSRLLKDPDQTCFQTAALSHKGYYREKNEDRLFIQSYISDDSERKHILLAVLADGVGGHRAGETAARIGVEEIVNAVSRADSLDQPTVFLKDAVEKANMKVVETSKCDPEMAGMGSTCVCALVIEDQLFIANLGDSRAYLMRNGKINQLTYDHTWLEEVGGGSGLLFGESSRSHPFAHVLKRYLGSGGPVRVDLRMRTGLGTEAADKDHTGGLKLQKKDRILLCSDGLTDLLMDEEIQKIAGEDPVQKSAQKLVFCALQKGGYDNVSVVLFEFTGPIRSDIF